MKNLIYSILLFLSMMLLSGCVQKPVALNPKISDPHIIVDNPSIYKWLKIKKINYYKRKDKLLVVEVTFKNLASTNKKIAYKLEWFDKNGFIQKTILSRWIVSEIEQRREFVVYGIAPSIKVENFEIKLQKPTSNDKNRKDSYHNEYQN